MAMEEYRKGNRTLCVVIPTGGGKTVTAAAFAKRHVEKNPAAKILFTAHREELVSQAYDTLTDAGLQCGVIQASPTREYNPFRTVQVASIQTLMARDLVPDATMAIFDEVHHMPSDKWAALAMEYRKRRIPIIGLTATPIRADGRGFEGIMDAIVVPITMKQLIGQGFLVPYTLIAPPDVLKNDQIAQKPVDAYITHASGRKCIVFATNVKAAKEYTEQFNAAGIACATVWGEMDPVDRRRVLAAYKVGDIQVLTNVGVLTEGFDDKPTSCVIIARSVGSLALYLQMAGRGLRCSPESDKTDAIIIDLNGNCRKPSIGEPADDRDWTLEGLGNTKKNLEQAKERFCPVCKVLIDADSETAYCELCGIARPEAVPPTVVNVKLVKYAALQKETEAQRRARFEGMKAIARTKGYSQWQPHMKFKALYGERPPRAWW